MRWTIPPYGWNYYPYFTLIILAWDLELCICNNTNTNNPFNWHNAQFNLPCNTGYDPRLPSVLLIRFGGEIVVRFIVFFDDGHVYRLGAECVRFSLRKNCAGLKFIGNQEAARKRTAGGQQLLAWCGCCVYTEHDLPQNLLSQTKWGCL